MERQIAECTTYKELAQTLCNLVAFYACVYNADTAKRDFTKIIDLVNDAQARIDSYELDPEPED